MGKTSISLVLIIFLSFLALATLELNCTSVANPYIQSLPETLATEHGYITTNGTIEPSTMPIQHDGNFYKLTDNLLNYTLEIQRDNIVIDGNNFTLSLPAYGELDSNNMVKQPSAILSIYNRTNIVVENFNLTKYSNAMDIRNSSNIIILKNTIQNGNNGIAIQDSTNCSIVANQITNNNLHALFIRDCPYFNVSYNTISKNLDGGITVDRVFLSVDLPHQAIFTRNTLSENGFAIFFRSQHTNNIIFENNFLNQSFGVAFIGVNCTDNLVYDNYWSNTPVQILNYTQNELDPSPITSEISTQFNNSLFTLPLFAQSPSPTPTAYSPSVFVTLIVVTAVLVLVLTVASLLLHRIKTQDNKRETTKEL